MKRTVGLVLLTILPLMAGTSTKTITISDNNFYDRQDYETHDVGNCEFTVTRYGALGFMDSGMSGGVGFIYPAGGSNHLFYGSFCVGTDKDYVIDRYYNTAGDDTMWVTTPGGEIQWFEPGPGFMDEYSVAHYSDSGHVAAKGLVCDQYSWAYDEPGYDDFIIMQFNLFNETPSPITDLYVAIFMDWDLGAASANTGATDSALNLAWMHDVTPYVGQVILDPPPDSAHLIANLALIDHDIYVYPFSGLPDSFQIQFMDGTIQKDTTDRPFDWSLCTSAGPFTLDADSGSAIVAFAFIGGEDLDQLKAHASQAFDSYWLGIEENTSNVISSIELYPVISYQQPYFLRYSLDKETSLHIKVFDVAGRTVHSQEWSNVNGTGEVSFRLNHLSQGIYFVRIEHGEYSTAKKIILLE